MKPVHLLLSLAGHLVLLLAMGLVSLALSQPAPPPPDTIHISFGHLPPSAGGRRSTAQKTVELPTLEEDNRPKELPKPKEAPKPKDDPKLSKPAKPKPTDPVKPVTRAQAKQSTAKPSPVPAPAANVGADETGSDPEPATTGTLSTPDGTGPLAQQVGAGGSVQARGDAGAGDSYLGLVQSKIGRRWLPSASSTEGKPALATTVSFRIGPRGEVLEPTVFESSGLSVFDREALRAVADSNPLPPPPARFRANGLNIQFTFTYRP